MEDKKYYWIKLKTDFFNQDAIDFIMSQKNGCEYIVLYQMLCLKTANTNGQLTSKIGEMIVPYDVDRIVRDTKYFDVDTVTVAMELFKHLGLIYEQNDNTLAITGFEDMIGKEPDRTNAERQKRFRERQKQKRLETSENNVISNVTDNVTKRNESNVEIEIRDRDKSIEKDKEKDIDIINFKGIMDLYNSICISLPKAQKLTEDRKRKIKARYNNFDTDDFYKAFKKAEESDFLSGRKTEWKASFDWFIENDKNMTKVLEGNYDNRETIVQTPKVKTQQSMLAELEKL